MPDESIEIPIEIKPVKGFEDLAKVSTVVTKAVQLMETNVKAANNTIKSLGSTSLNVDVTPARNALNILTNQFERLKKIAALPNLNFSQLERINGLLARTSGEIDRFSKASVLAQRGFASMGGASSTATFALTNFGRIAQDIPYGMIGIANNIVPLIESMQRLGAEAKATGVSMGTQLLNSLKGGGGLILGFSILTSVMQFAAVGLSAFTRGMGGSGKAAEDATKDIRTFNQVVGESTASVQGDIAKINALTNAFANTSSFEKQKRVISELAEINENYFGKLEAGKSSYHDIAAAANEYTEALVAQAVVKGFSDEISKVATELAKAKDKYREAAIASSNYNERLKAIRDLPEREHQRSIAFTTLELEKQLNAVVALQEEFNRLSSEIQGAVGETFKFKPLQAPDKKDFDDKTDDIIARAKAFVKQFGEVFETPDLEDSFTNTKDKILKSAEKLLDDVSKKHLKIKLPKFDADDTEGLVPFIATPDPNFKFDEDGKIRESILQQMKAEFEEPLVIDPTIRLAIDNEKIKADFDKAVKSGNFGAALDLFDTDKSIAGIQGLNETLKTTADVFNDTLAPAAADFVDALLKGENPVKAMLSSLVQSINQVIKRLIVAAIEASLLSALTGGASNFGTSFLSFFGGGRGGAANFGSRVGFAGGGAGAANFTMNAVLRGPDIYLSGVSGARSVSRAGG